MGSWKMSAAGKGQEERGLGARLREGPVKIVTEAGEPREGSLAEGGGVGDAL